MSIIKWNNDLGVNIAEIDRQHQQLIILINELHSAMLQGRGQQILGKIMKGLSEYIDEHFTTEEKYFHQFNYPDRDDHIREHTEFTEKINEFKQDMLRGDQNITIEMIDFLSEWLANHILILDKKYEQFLHQHGVH